MYQGQDHTTNLFFSKQNRVGAKRCISDDAFECIHDFSIFLIYVQDIMNGQKAAVIYDKAWWIGLVAENFEEVQDGKVKSMHQKFHQNFDTCDSLMIFILK